MCPPRISPDHALSPISSPPGTNRSLIQTKRRLHRCSTEKTLHQLPGYCFSHGARRRRCRVQGSIGGVPKHPRIPFKGPRVPCFFRFCFTPLFLSLEWSIYHQLQRCSNDTPRIYLKRFLTGVLAMQCLVCLVLLEFCQPSLSANVCFQSLACWALPVDSTKVSSEQPLLKNLSSRNSD